MDVVEREIVSQFKQKVAARVPLHQMVLFGSRAREQAEPGSDLDVLVVLNDPVDESVEDAVSQCAWEAGFEAGIVIAPVTVSRRAWEEGPERHSLFAMAIRNDGIAI